MSSKKLSIHVLTVLVLLLACSSLAHAQATRTWVSGVGDDVNPCSRTAPCKTFAGAISKTAAGGAINVLDPGGFGGVTITKALTISSEGFEGGVLVSGTNAIVVNVPNATDVVVLRGLDIEGLGTGLNGITVIQGGAVQVEKCTINNFTQSGINFAPTVANSQLHVSDTIVRNNGNFAASTGQGIFVAPGSLAKATLSRVRLENNVAGLKVQGASNTTVVDSVASNNATLGFGGFGSPAILTVERSVATHNGTAILCNSGTSVRLGNMSIVDNPITLGGTGSCSSFGNNDIDVVGTFTHISPQ
jgi:hypothetical protein